MKTPGHSGWDGQFHFYIANDLLLQKDTAQHIDAPTYRYQRIGLPLLARGLAFLTFSDWVSPLAYWGTSVLLVAAGTFAFAWMLATLGLPPWLSLVWALSGGVQVCKGRMKFPQFGRAKNPQTVRVLMDWFRGRRASLSVVGPGDAAPVAGW